MIKFPNVTDVTLETPDIFSQKQCTVDWGFGLSACRHFHQALHFKFAFRKICLKIWEPMCVPIICVMWIQNGHQPYQETCSNQLRGTYRNVNISKLNHQLLSPYSHQQLIQSALANEMYICSRGLIPCVRCKYKHWSFLRLDVLHLNKTWSVGLFL